MQRVEYGKTGKMITRLGFGVLRLPSEIRGKELVYDEDKSVDVIRHAIDSGINYFDTAPSYCGKLSQSILGKAIRGKRDQLYLSTKFDTKDTGLMVQFENSLAELGTDRIDFYHFWSMDLAYFADKGLAKGGPLDQMTKLKEQGSIGHIAFSSHDTPENIMEIIRRGEGRFEALLCQYNLLDRRNEKVMAYAKSLGMGVSVMGPMGGGRLGRPSELMDVLPGGASTASAETALRFVFSNPDVDIALSGMNTRVMIDENILAANDPRPLSDEEQQHIRAVVEEKKKLSDLYCTACNYCMPCPAGINIPEVFKIYNYHRVYGITAYARQQYGLIGTDGDLDFSNASACTGCGLCEKHCPQKLNIREELKRAHEILQP
ncbi:MAG: aldo/keto reductase [Eubacteriales bacterium]|nr:aldo/keto reductase [Eubacteriales bacterium]MDD4444956.1 aldo/keto reductase [Eubacteriales bacterium]